MNLPGFGTCLVSTDIHGNGEDFRMLRDLFLQRRRDERDAHWILLGDVIHAPSPSARRENPDLYDYPDESAAIIQELMVLSEREAGHVHFLLGNHEHAHVGGPRTSKFYEDEAAHLEAQVDEATRTKMHAFFNAAPLIAVAPCGVAFCHGSPDERLESLKQLVGMPYDIAALDGNSRELLHGILNSYGQSAEVTQRVLKHLMTCTGYVLSVLVHGHDRDVAGWFAEGGNQLCPVLFGAPRGEKRYLDLDLGAHYRGLDRIRDGIELRRLYPG